MQLASSDLEITPARQKRPKPILRLGQQRLVLKRLQPRIAGALQQRCSTCAER
jgi:hypothetical protein